MSLPSSPAISGVAAVLACQAESTMVVMVRQRVCSLATMAIALGVAAGATAQPPDRNQPGGALSTAQATVLSADDPLLAARDAARRGDRHLLSSFAPRIPGHLPAASYAYWKASLG